MRPKPRTWDSELAEIVQTTWPVGETFTMQNVYGRCETEKNPVKSAAVRKSAKKNFRDTDLADDDELNAIL